MNDDNYRTYLFARNPIHGHLDLPEIDGRQCVGIACDDLFEERDAAFSLLARIADGQLKSKKAAMKFLTARGYGKTYLTLIDD